MSSPISSKRFLFWKWLSALLLVCVLDVAALNAQAPVPAKGYVPNDKTAIMVAKAVLQGMYGEHFVNSQAPFEAELKDGIWEVYGRANHDPHIKGGGGLDMRINQQTGAILGYYFMR